MGTIADKLLYMNNAVDDIQLAINECKVEVDDSVELGLYGDKIREIANSNGNNIKDFYVIEKFDSFSRMELFPKTVEEITDYVIIGSVDGLDSLDCITCQSFISFLAKDIEAKEVVDVSDLYQF